MPEPTQFPDPQQQPGGEIRDRSLRPSGLLPKNTQTYVIMAIAVIMVGAIAFSGGGNTAKQSTNSQPKAAAVIDPNLARIQDYRNRIDEEARKLAAEQAQLEQAKQALGLPAANQATAAPAFGGPSPVRPMASQTAYQPPPARPEKSAIEAEKEKREYQSLFASNIALTYRKEENAFTEQTNGAAASLRCAASHRSGNTVVTSDSCRLQLAICGTACRIAVAECCNARG